MEPDYRTVNRAGWDRLARWGCDSSRPYGVPEFAEAVNRLDGRRWLPWGEFEKVLCLAAGGGQQAPLFAYLGYDVTLVDLSSEQLQRDQEVAGRHGLRICCVQADMLDLSGLPPEAFDLVYQPISSLYVPDVVRCYREVARVLRGGGLYHAEHWNPVQMQVAQSRPWDGQAYRLARRPAEGAVAWSAGPDTGETCRHYIHPLGDLIGGLGPAGFVILRFGERNVGDGRGTPGTDSHLSGYLPTFFTILARRWGDNRRGGIHAGRR